MTWWDSGIKTCRSHTATSAQGRASGRGGCERAPLLAETGIHPPLDKLGSPECCSRSDHLLQRRVSLRVKEIKGIRARQSDVLSAMLSHGEGAVRIWGVFARTSSRPTEENARNNTITRLTTSVCHAVEKEPGVEPGAVFDEAHVVAGMNAEDGEQLHHAPGNGSVSGSTRRCCQQLGGVPLAGGMSMHLRKQQRFYGLFLG